MMTPLRLRTSDMSPVSEEGTTASPRTPARGRETRAALLQKLRPPQLVHAWVCWIERLSNDVKVNTVSKETASPYKPHLTQLTSITDVRGFWSLFNNLPLSTLQRGTSCHLFHKSITPVWEDARNARGGSWTFRIPRSIGAAFFEEICLLAIGEVLQEAVEDETKTKFRDDICGVTFAPKSLSHTLVSVWNRDGENEKGIAMILETILEKVSETAKPKEGSWYYKKHSDHPGFVGSASSYAGDMAAVTGNTENPKPTAAGLITIEEESSGPACTMAQIEKDVRKVRQILEELKVANASTSAVVGEVGSM